MKTLKLIEQIEKEKGIQMIDAGNKGITNVIEINIEKLNQIMKILSGEQVRLDLSPLYSTFTIHIPKSKWGIKKEGDEIPEEYLYVKSEILENENKVQYLISQVYNPSDYKTGKFNPQYTGLIIIEYDMNTQQTSLNVAGDVKSEVLIDKKYNKSIIDSYVKKLTKAIHNTLSREDSLNANTNDEDEKHFNATVYSLVNAYSTFVSVLTYINYAYKNADRIKISTKSDNSIHSTTKSDIINNNNENKQIISIGNTLTIKSYESNNISKRKYDIHTMEWEKRGYWRTYKSGKRVYIQPKKITRPQVKEGQAAKTKQNKIILK